MGAPPFARRASADAASVQAALVAVLTSGRPLPCAVRAAVADLGRSCPATLPFPAAPGGGRPLAAAGGGLQPTTPAR